jgi:quercetin dioxygenase-like cupin family protein
MQQSPATENRHEVEAPPFSRFDLEEEVRRMRAAAKPGGHLGKTLVRAADLRVVLMILQRGARIPEHRAGGPSSIQGIDGRVRLTLAETSLELGPGQLVAIDPDVTHALEAAEDSAVLLTISFRGHPRGP